LRAGDDLDAVHFCALDAIPDLAFPTDALVIDGLRQIKLQGSRGKVQG